MNRRVFVISVFSVIVQYYDYHLFGLLASKISQHLIPQNDPTTKLFYAYCIMGIAVTAKPLGALLIGRIGDIYSRLFSINISIFFTAIGSFAIFLIPDYEVAGTFSLILLILARMLTCAFVSSGSDGVRILVYEYIGPNQQCFGVGIVIVSTLIGSFFASLSSWVVTLDTHDQNTWRYAFLFGTILGIIILIINLIFHKDLHFTNIKNEESFEKFKNFSLFKIIKQNLRLFIICSVVAGSIGSINQFCIIFFATYNFEILKIIDESTMKYYSMLYIIINAIFYLIGGMVADYFDKFRTIKIVFVPLVILTILMAISTSYHSPIYLIFFAIMSITPFFIIPSMIILKQSIPKVIRYRLFSISHAVGSIFISGPTASFCIYLIQKTNIETMPFLYFSITLCLIFISTYLLQEKIR